MPVCSTTRSEHVAKKPMQSVKKETSRSKPCGLWPAARFLNCRGASRPDAIVKKIKEPVLHGEWQNVPQNETGETIVVRTNALAALGPDAGGTHCHGNRCNRRLM
jgi:hypothetical protein